MTGSEDFTPSPLSTLPFSSQPFMSEQENERLSTSSSEQQVENRPGHTGPLCLTYSTPKARCVLPDGQGLPDPGPNVAAQVGSRAWERGPWKTARRKALNTHLVAPPPLPWPSAELLLMFPCPQRASVPYIHFALHHLPLLPILCHNIAPRTRPKVISGHSPMSGLLQNRSKNYEPLPSPQKGMDLKNHTSVECKTTQKKQFGSFYKS